MRNIVETPGFVRRSAEELIRSRTLRLYILFGNGYLYNKNYYALS